jgi:integrase
MNLHMRLFKRGKTYYGELERNHKVSLKTGDAARAGTLYRALKKDFLSNRLAVLTGRPASKSLGEFAAEYLEWSDKTRARFTVATDRQSLNRLVEYLGAGTALTGIARLQIDRWAADAALSVRKSSVNTWLRHIKAALSKAAEWDYIKESPGKGVKPLKDYGQLPRYLEKEEIKLLLAAEDDPQFKQLWLFYLLTGCRRGEALQIQGQDINWQEGRLVVGQTKNRCPKVIWITPELEVLLRSTPAVGRLFPWQADTVTHAFHRTALKAGLKCRLHDLRHTYASHKAMAGVDPWTLKELMGHKDLKSTMLYSHLSPAHLKKAAGKGSVGEG